MSKIIAKIGPADHGRRMTLEEFDEAEGQEGYLYELSRGIVTVSDVPNRLHLLIVAAIRNLLQAYEATKAGRIQIIAAGSECKLPIGAFASERHPDLSLYLTPAPEIDDETLWAQWIPEIVIEVVSPNSRKRDYEEKPAEYLRFGVKEYWIVDSDERVMVVMRRSRGRWAETIVRPGDIHRTRLLPGLEFSIDAVFKNAGLS
jgi:Uma2 family endonuclease